MPINNPFPRWGDSGDKPPDGTQFNGGDTYPESYVDYLWATNRSFANQVQNEFESNLDATTYKGNDIDVEGNGRVDEAEYAYDGNATQYKGNDIDDDGDGVVNKADDVVTRYRNTDIPKTELNDGDVAVGRELYVPSGWRIRFYEYGLEPDGSVVPSGLYINAFNISDNNYLIHDSARHSTVDPDTITRTGGMKMRLSISNQTGSTTKASGGLVWTLHEE